MHQNKRASTEAIFFVCTLLILAVSLYLLFPYVGKTIFLLDDEKEAYICTLSILRGGGTALCPIHDIVITDKEIIKNGKVAKPLQTKTSDARSEAVAQLLRNCMQKGGGSNSDAFSRENNFFTERICLICNTLSLESDLSGVTAYLQSANPPGIKDKTYMDSLTESDDHKQAYVLQGGVYDMIPSTSDQTLQKGENYAIIYLGMKEGDVPDLWRSAKAWASLSVYEAVFQNDDTFFSYIIKSEDLPNACQRIVN